MYNELIKLHPYLQSIRFIEGYITFDILFPKSWKLLKKYVQEDRFMEQETKNSMTHRLCSFVSGLNEDEFNNTLSNILNIISHNLEIEEKDNLFEKKVQELRDIFEKQSLNSLKMLEFNLQLNKEEIKNENIEKKVRLVKSKDITG